MTRNPIQSCRCLPKARRDPASSGLPGSPGDTRPGTADPHPRSRVNSASLLVNGCFSLGNPLTSASAPIQTLPPFPRFTPVPQSAFPSRSRRSRRQIIHSPELSLLIQSRWLYLQTKNFLGTKCRLLRQNLLLPSPFALLYSFAVRASSRTFANVRDNSRYFTPPGGPRCGAAPTLPSAAPHSAARWTGSDRRFSSRNTQFSFTFLETKKNQNGYPRWGGTAGRAFRSFSRSFCSDLICVARCKRGLAL